MRFGFGTWDEGTYQYSGKVQRIDDGPTSFQYTAVEDYSQGVIGNTMNQNKSQRIRRVKVIRVARCETSRVPAVFILPQFIQERCLFITSTWFAVTAFRVAATMAANPSRESIPYVHDGGGSCKSTVMRWNKIYTSGNIIICHSLLFFLKKKYM